MTPNELLRVYAPWMVLASSMRGQAEIPGPKTAGFIAGMLKGLHAWWGDDETPWCGVFAAHCLKESGLPTAKAWWRAKGWVDFGIPLPPSLNVRSIPYGALVVLNRPPKPGDGHVGFFDRSTYFSTGDGVSLLAGNQGNQVCSASFPRQRVAYWCWPGPPLPPSIAALLVAMANGQGMKPVPVSSGEA